MEIIKMWTHCNFSLFQSWNYFQKLPTPPQLYFYILWIGYANSAINPLIYAFHHHDFKEVFTGYIINIKCWAMNSSVNNNGNEAETWQTGRTPGGTEMGSCSCFKLTTRSTGIFRDPKESCRSTAIVLLLQYCFGFHYVNCVFSVLQ